MKKLLAVLLLVASAGAVAWDCTVHDYEMNGKRIRCETCCDSFGCKTRCRER